MIHSPYHDEVLRLERILDREDPGWRRRSAYWTRVRQLLKIRPLARKLRQYQQCPVELQGRLLPYRLIEPELNRLGEELGIRPLEIKIVQEVELELHVRFHPKEDRYYPHNIPSISGRYGSSYTALEATANIYAFIVQVARLERRKSKAGPLFQTRPRSDVTAHLILQFLLDEFGQRYDLDAWRTLIFHRRLIAETQSYEFRLEGIPAGSRPSVQITVPKEMASHLEFFPLHHWEAAANRLGYDTNTNLSGGLVLTRRASWNMTVWEEAGS